MSVWVYCWLYKHLLKGFKGLLSFWMETFKHRNKPAFTPRMKSQNTIKLRGMIAVTAKDSWSFCEKKQLCNYPLSCIANVFPTFAPRSLESVENWAICKVYYVYIHLTTTWHHLHIPKQKVKPNIKKKEKKTRLRTEKKNCCSSWRLKNRTNKPLLNHY